MIFAASMNGTAYGMDITQVVKRNNFAVAQYESILHCTAQFGGFTCEKLCNKRVDSSFDCNACQPSDGIARSDSQFCHLNLSTSRNLANVYVFLGFFRQESSST
ncbi:hypothetical protein SPHV1_220022 [Novosphingobium sp. KN65.2]|nr:hypothetical protein SPHV1_220022 [Novosphingobium sp. KN65.2]